MACTSKFNCDSLETLKQFMQYRTKYLFLIHVKSGNHSIISGDLEKS